MSTPATPLSLQTAFGKLSQDVKDGLTQALADAHHSGEGRWRVTEETDAQQSHIPLVVRS